MGSPTPPKIVVTINSTGRQAASFIRVASAVGWRVRAQIRNRDGLVYQELAELPGIDFVEGELEKPGLIESIFQGAQVAFVNTTHYGNEYATGKKLADCAKAAGIQHFVYSSMPDHSIFGRGWEGLPLWAVKFRVEQYVRAIGIPATFVYAGIYNNNFTSLPYPLFRLALQPDKSFVWQAPFPLTSSSPGSMRNTMWDPPCCRSSKKGLPDGQGTGKIYPSPQGPVVGPSKDTWSVVSRAQLTSQCRIPLTFEVLTPVEACAAMSRGLGRPVRYRHGPIEFLVPVPPGYKQHLLTLQKVLGEAEAPYFGPTMYYPHEAIQLWEGNRGLEEYAREAFPVEEAANGLTWMDDESGVDTDDYDEVASNTDGVHSSQPSIAGDSANAMNL